jgi:hypothetical protein
VGWEWEGSSRGAPPAACLRGVARRLQVAPGSSKGHQASLRPLCSVISSTTLASTNPPRPAPPTARQLLTRGSTL